jgi:hypothetical protein
LSCATVNTGAFQVYNIANNQLTGSASLGAVGLDWQLGGVAANARVGSDWLLGGLAAGRQKATGALLFVKH